MNRIVPIFLVLIAFHSCQRKTQLKRDESEDNSNCIYSETIYPAKVIELLPQGGPSIYDGPLDICFEIGLENNKKDTIYYSHLMGKEMETNDLLKNKISEGKIYNYIVQTLISGECPPVRVKLELREFN